MTKETVSEDVLFGLGVVAKELIKLTELMKKNEQATLKGNNALTQSIDALGDTIQAEGKRSAKGLEVVLGAFVEAQPEPYDMSPLVDALKTIAQQNAETHKLLRAIRQTLSAKKTFTYDANGMVNGSKVLEAH